MRIILAALLAAAAACGSSETTPPVGVHGFPPHGTTTTATPSGGDAAVPDGAIVIGTDAGGGVPVGDAGPADASQRDAAQVPTQTCGNGVVCAIDWICCPTSCVPPPGPCPG